MKYGAQPSDKVSPAPVGVVRWNIRLRGEPQPSIDAHSWFEARARAMLLYGCSSAELSVKLQGASDAS